MFFLEGADETIARQAGYDTPVRLSPGVKAIIDRAVADPDWLNDWNGVLWDVLQMSTNPRIARRIETDPTAARFSVIITGVSDRRPWEGDLDDDLEEHLVELVCQVETAVVGVVGQCFIFMTPGEYRSRRAFNLFRKTGGLGWIERSLN